MCHEGWQHCGSRVLHRAHLEAGVRAQAERVGNVARHVLLLKHVLGTLHDGRLGHALHRQLPPRGLLRDLRACANPPASGRIHARDASGRIHARGVAWRCRVHSAPPPPLSCTRCQCPASLSCVCKAANLRTCTTLLNAPSPSTGPSMSTSGPPLPSEPAPACVQEGRRPIRCPLQPGGGQKAARVRTRAPNPGVHVRAPAICAPPCFNSCTSSRWPVARVTTHWLPSVPAPLKDRMTTCAVWRGYKAGRLGFSRAIFWFTACKKQGERRQARHARKEAACCKTTY